MMKLVTVSFCVFINLWPRPWPRDDWPRPRSLWPRPRPHSFWPRPHELMASLTSLTFAQKLAFAERCNLYIHTDFQILSSSLNGATLTGSVNCVRRNFRQFQ